MRWHLCLVVPLATPPAHPGGKERAWPATVLWQHPLLLQLLWVAIKPTNLCLQWVTTIPKIKKPTDWSEESIQVYFLLLISELIKIFHPEDDTVAFHRSVHMGTKGWLSLSQITSAPQWPHAWQNHLRHSQPHTTVPHQPGKGGKWRPSSLWSSCRSKLPQ